MRKLAAFWLKFLVFLCLLAIAVNATGTLLSGGDDVTQSASSLKHLPAESVDVLWLGTSHMNYNIIPQYLYDLCGVTSAMATGNSVDLDASYWMLRQALLTQSPQVLCWTCILRQRRTAISMCRMCWRWNTATA